MFNPVWDHKYSWRRFIVCVCDAYMLTWWNQTFPNLCCLLLQTACTHALPWQPQWSFLPKNSCRIQKINPAGVRRGRSNRRVFLYVGFGGITGTFRDRLSSSSTALIQLHYDHSTSELQQPSQDSVHQSVTELVPPHHPCPVSCIDTDIIQCYFGQWGLKGKCSSKTATGNAETRR